jgi:hypothetical protein
VKLRSGRFDDWHNVCIDDVFHLFSALSRILEIKFSKPTCGPKCPAEIEIYHELNKDLKQNAYSKSVGFIIKLGGLLLSSGDERVKELQSELQFSHSLMERNVCGWSILLFFLEQVRS